MGLAQDYGCWRNLAIGITLAGGLFAGTARAQSSGMGRMSSAPAEKWEKKSVVRDEVEVGGKTTVSADPYGGQIYCPVSGNKLGLTNPACPVQTSIGATTPGAIARLFGKKATPGAVIFVCCPKCAETVRQNPERYLGIVINDRASLSSIMSYADAPPMHPEHQAEAVIQPASYKP